MSEYSSCLLQGYGVLAGPPTRVKARLISSRFAIVEWNTPKILPETVTSYNVHLRKMNTDEAFTVIEKDHTPIIIEDLDSKTYYEAYVVAVNAHGRGPPSSRLVFQTKPQVISILIVFGHIALFYSDFICIFRLIMLIQVLHQHTTLLLAVWLLQCYLSACHCVHMT